MVEQIKFRPDTLMQLGDTWTVEGVMRQGEDQYSIRMPCIVIPDSVATWLQTLKVVIIQERENSGRTGATPYLATDYYQCDVVLDEDMATVSKVYPNLNPGTVTGSEETVGTQGRVARFAELYETAERVRTALENSVWPKVLRTFPSEKFTFPPDSEIRSSTGMCWISALCTVEILTEAFPNGQWKNAGGHPVAGYEHLFTPNTFRSELDGGLLSPAGNWCGHEWVTGVFGGEQVIVDLTGDQFGFPSVYVCPSDDERYRSNYSDEKLAKGRTDKRVTDLVELALNAWDNMTSARSYA